MKFTMIIFAAAASALASGALADPAPGTVGEGATVSFGETPTNDPASQTTVEVPAKIDRVRVDNRTGRDASDWAARSVVVVVTTQQPE